MHNNIEITGNHKTKLNFTFKKGKNSFNKINFGTLAFVRKFQKYNTHDNQRKGLQTHKEQFIHWQNMNEIVVLL